MFLKDEEKFGLIFDDSTFDSRQGEIVDFAVANGLMFLNLKGFGKPERSAKVDRLQEILEELRNMQVERERAAETTNIQDKRGSGQSLGGQEAPGTASAMSR